MVNVKSYERKIQEYKNIKSPDTFDARKKEYKNYLEKKKNIENKIKKDILVEAVDRLNGLGYKFNSNGEGLVPGTKQTMVIIPKVYLGGWNDSIKWEVNSYKVGYGNREIFGSKDSNAEIKSKMEKHIAEIKVYENSKDIAKNKTIQMAKWLGVKPDSYDGVNYISNERRIIYKLKNPDYKSWHSTQGRLIINNNAEKFNVNFNIAAEFESFEEAKKFIAFYREAIKKYYDVEQVD